MTPLASGAAFPPVVPLASLYPAGGGDGTQGFVLTGVDSGDNSGWSVSAAGDVNGDGIGDVIVGARYANTRAGESYVVFGSSAGFPAVRPLASLFPAGGGDGTRGFVLSGYAAHDHSGGSVSAAGDINGDGVDDLIVGAKGADRRGDFVDRGESYVVFGSSAGFEALMPLARLYPAGGGDGTRGFVLTGVDENDYAGYSVSAAGDINGDGIDDLIVGAFHANPRGNEQAGESYVVFGSTAAFPAVMPLANLYPAGGGDGTRGFVLTGIAANTYSGISVSAAGDVNGDGVGDLIIGAPHDPRKNSRPCESFVVFGSTAGFPAVIPLVSLYPAGGGDGTRGFVLIGLDGVDRSGAPVSAAGDINGDGIDDVIVGAAAASPGGDLGAGESYVVFGSSAGFPAVMPLASLFPADGGDGTRGFVLTGIDRGDNSGSSVSDAGDVNGDGIDDLIVGAPGARSVAGESYVVFGSSAGFPAVVPLAGLHPAGGGDGTAGFILTGVDTSDLSGNSVSAAGDVNGDGVDDLIIGARLTSESYVIFGRGALR